MRQNHVFSLCVTLILWAVLPSPLRAASDARTRYFQQAARAPETTKESPSSEVEGEDRFSALMKRLDAIRARISPGAVAEMESDIELQEIEVERQEQLRARDQRGKDFSAKLQHLDQTIQSLITDGGGWENVKGDQTLVGRLGQLYKERDRLVAERKEAERIWQANLVDLDIEGSQARARRLLARTRPDTGDGSGMVPLRRKLEGAPPVEPVSADDVKIGLERGERKFGAHRSAAGGKVGSSDRRPSTSDSSSEPELPLYWYPAAETHDDHRSSQENTDGPAPTPATPTGQ